MQCCSMVFPNLFRSTVHLPGLFRPMAHQSNVEWAGGGGWQVANWVGAARYKCGPGQGTVAAWGGGTGCSHAFPQILWHTWTCPMAHQCAAAVEKCSFSSMQAYTASPLPAGALFRSGSHDLSFSRPEGYCQGQFPGL